MAIARVKLPLIGQVRIMDNLQKLADAVKTTKLGSGRNCLSHHMSKGCPGGPVANLASIGFSNLQAPRGNGAGGALNAPPGNGAGGALNLQFPEFFASPEVDQQTFDCEGGCMWRCDGGPAGGVTKELEEESACEILVFLFARHFRVTWSRQGWKWGLAVGAREVGPQGRHRCSHASSLTFRCIFRE